MKINEFLASIDGLSDNTKRAYENTLWLLEEEIPGDEPTDEEVEAFLKKYPPSSLQRHKAAIKAYYEESKPKREWPFTARTFRQVHTVLPRTGDPKVAEDMIAAATNPDEKMFVRTLYQLGCRITELQRITDKNITKDGIALVTKGGNVQLKLATKAFLEELKQYAAKKKGRPFPRTYTYYSKVIKDLGKKAGHPEVSCHFLRHCRAIDLENKGMTQTEIQHFLGHKNPNTTAIYLRRTNTAVADRLEAAETAGSKKEVRT